MGKRSRSHGRSSHSSTSSSSPSPPPLSKSHGNYRRGSSSLSTMSSRESTPRKSKKNKTSEGKECPIPGMTPKMTEEFFKAEEELRSDHLADYDIFRDVPEVHPDYSSNYQTFMDQFSKRFGDDPDRCSELWETFWNEVINEKQEQDWETKRAVLIKQFQMKLMSQEKHKKQEKLESDSGDSHNKNSEIVKNEVEHRKGERINVLDDVNENRTRKAISSSPAQDDSSKLHSIPQLGTINKPLTSIPSSSSRPSNESDIGVSQNACLSYSLELLEEVSESLGEIAGSLLRRVIMKIKDLESEKEKLIFLTNNDTKTILQWSSERLTKLSTRVTGAERSKFVHCSNIALKLIQYGSEGMWNEKFHGLDIKDVAAATYNKDLETTVKIIKEALRCAGIDEPTTEVINNLFTNVSARHLKIALGNN